jgi:hypothetical protein
MQMDKQTTRVSASGSVQPSMYFLRLWRPIARSPREKSRANQIKQLCVQPC